MSQTPHTLEDPAVKSAVRDMKPTILIVDDDVRFRRLIQGILEKEGYATVAAQSGTDGIAAAEKLKPDIIFLDIYMPETNGIEVCKRLKEKDSTRDIPVIFVTVNTDDTILKEAFDAGCLDYIHKPLNRVELLVRTEHVLLRALHLRLALQEEKMRGIAELARTVCHELSQPMQVILGYSELLLPELSKDHPFHPMLEAITEQIGRMREITAKITHITRYEIIEHAGCAPFINLDKASDSVDVPENR